MAEKIIYASYTAADSAYAEAVLDVFRKSGYPVIQAPVSEIKADGIYLFFFSKNFAADSQRMDFMRKVLSIGLSYASVNLDNYEPDPNTKMLMSRFQSLFAKDFESPQQLGTVAADALKSDRDPDIPQYEGNGKYLFISYSHADSMLVHAVADELKKRNVNLWYDRNLMFGTLWSKEIAQHIDASNSFVAFVSKTFAGSLNCTAEINLAASAETESLVTVIRMKGTKLDEGIEMYIKSGATILKYEQFRNVQDLVDGLFKQPNGVKECRIPDLLQEDIKQSGGIFSNLFHKDNVIPKIDISSLITSLYPQDSHPSSRPSSQKAKNIKQLQQTALAAQKLEEQFREYADYSSFKNRTADLKERLNRGETAEYLMPEALANAAAVFGMMTGEVILLTTYLCALAMAQGAIAQTQESEQHLAAIFMAAYAEALNGKGVHIMTSRDSETAVFAEAMKESCDLLGISLGAVDQSTLTDARKKQYDCDITVVSRSQAGFDYLRDHLVINTKYLRMRPLNSVILNEADEIILNYGENTISITRKEKKDNSILRHCMKLTDSMTEGKDYLIQNGAVKLTAAGIEKAGRYFRIDFNYNSDNLIIHSNILTALKARSLYTRDIDYIVAENEIRPVNNQTGMAEGNMTFTGGIMQALQMKESLPVTAETAVEARISMHGLLQLYSKKAGIARAALQSEEELKQDWGFSVMEIPVNRPTLRKDLADRFYVIHDYKINAIVKDAFAAADSGRAVVIGTPYIKDFNDLRNSLIHEAKTNKHHCTISAISPGLSDDDAESFLLSAGYPNHITLLSGYYTRGIEIVPDSRCIDKGGLFVIASSHFKNATMDEQLRCICRSYDPSETVTYFSIDDPYVRNLYSENQRQSFIDLIGNSKLESRFVTKTMQKYMKNVQAYEASRKRVTAAYNSVEDQQRKLVYQDREHLLTGQQMEDIFDRILHEYAKNTIRNIDSDALADTSDLNSLIFKVLSADITRYLDPTYGKGIKKPRTDSQLEEAVCNCLQEASKTKFQQIDDLGSFRFSERSLGQEMFARICLGCIDRNWGKQLLQLTNLRRGGSIYDGIQDYLPIYQKEALKEYEWMITAICNETVESFFSMQIASRNTDSDKTKRPVRRTRTPSPNDPCPCGSGKKYKQCHGRH